MTDEIHRTVDGQTLEFTDEDGENTISLKMLRALADELEANDAEAIKLNSDVDADGHDIEGVGSLHTEGLETDELGVGTGEDDGADIIETHTGSGEEWRKKADGFYQARGLDVDQVGGAFTLNEDQTLPSDQWETLELETVENADAGVVSLDPTSHEVTFERAGDYLLMASVTYEGDSNWSNGDRVVSEFVGDISNTVGSFGWGLKVGDDRQTFNVSTITFDRLEGLSFTINTRQESGSDQVVSSSRTRTGVEILYLG